MATTDASSKLDSADRLLASALEGAAGRLRAEESPLTDLREEDLRSALHDELLARLPGQVSRERGLKLSAFQCLGPFDLRIDRLDGSGARWLAEVKWSYQVRDKLFEAAWDAVKLALAQVEHAVERSWLIAGASKAAWERTECADLFTDGVVDTRDLLARALDPPGSNGGRTVAEDLSLGGRGNVFTRAPRRLRIRHVGSEHLARGDERWIVRAAAIAPDGGWLEGFAPEPLFPARITQSWLEANVPHLTDTEYSALLERLVLKRWTEEELRTRVHPLRPA